MPKPTAVRKKPFNVAQCPRPLHDSLRRAAPCSHQVRYHYQDGDWSEWRDSEGFTVDV